MNTKRDKLKLMKKSALFLLTLFYSFTLLLSSTTSSFADCGTINVTGGTCTVPGGVSCSSNPTVCCSPASECSTATPPPAICPPPMTQATCDAISKLFASPPPDGPWYNQNPSQFAAKVTDPTNASDIFGERYTYAQINWIINSLATMLNPTINIRSATDLINFIEVVGTLFHASRPTIQDYAKLGPAGLFAGGISALYSNPPASGVGEIKTLASKIFDLGTGTKPAYAQGYGFNSLSTSGGVRILWSASRNMAYLIMIILLIASGFLIMFRVKINPQTVVSMQTMIPKLIITMLLVTFSFAAVGLVVDLIYVFIAAFVGALSLATNPPIISNIPGLIKNLTSGNAGSYAWAQIPGTLFLLIIAAAVFFMALIVTIGSPFLGVVGIFAAVFVALLGLWALIIFLKIFWMLMKSYVMLLLLIIVGPLQIMLDLIPGQQGFGPWIRNVIANASVFVTVPILLVIQHIMSPNPFSDFLNCTGANSQSCLYISSSFTGLGGTTLELPFTTQGLASNSTFSVLIGYFVGFTIFSLTPKIADMIRDALKIPAFKYGAAIGETFHGVTAAPRSLLNARANLIEQQVSDEVKTSGPSAGTAYKAGVAQQFKQWGK